MCVCVREGERGRLLTSECDKEKKEEPEQQYSVAQMKGHLGLAPYCPPLCALPLKCARLHQHITAPQHNLPFAVKTHF